ncbi:decaprenyl-phosphate phosphoribosyltransferase [Marivivens sp. JLT3646]|uniref:decaprenyl-phosphate phosphoribosyltransferase n=1 Tax=Marivivens sp. JLT3646 TaxID=1920883 RepID=UPI0008006757|nr:decaprenyl-phosphate phosphoribosyltransferase [Marivivens sp. JLT3646]APO88553.1 decaprenyl-phosphate phosphoribosyltransferase [Marivivens sp. JLT3646]OBR39255.1 phosphoribose diphosphate--decaprenyl-phosphate phosphoribosyltransferase [Donghicola sp. JL3646]
MNTYSGLFKLLRPKHWIKNLFVLAPLIFSGMMTEFPKIIDCMIASVMFCLASSATYVLNDFIDIDRDRRHPVKSKTRPLAAGLVSQKFALLLLAFLYVVLTFGYFINVEVFIIIVLYLLLNFAYTFVLKHMPVIDIFVIAVGFVLRVAAGTTAIQLPSSSWMLITSLCLALYLAAIKRRQEISNSGLEGRKVLETYSVSLMDRYALISATGAMIYYSMYVMSVKPDLAVTVPFVVFGLFRYWYIVDVLDGGESPTDALTSDWQLLLTIFLWGSVSILVLWPSVG